MVWYGLPVGQLSSPSRVLVRDLGFRSTDQTNRGSVDNGWLQMADTGTRPIVYPPQTQVASCSCLVGVRCVADRRDSRRCCQGGPGPEGSGCKESSVYPGLTGGTTPQITRVKGDSVLSNIHRHTCHTPTCIPRSTIIDYPISSSS